MTASTPAHLPVPATAHPVARHDDVHAVGHAALCGNCGAKLAGPYCSQCGQHAHESTRGIGALLHDAWHVITHVDGRFWATIGALFLKPGVLTVEYFANHRARFVQPFRLYLVCSIVFFGLTSLIAKPENAINLNDDDTPALVAVKVPVPDKPAVPVNPGAEGVAAGAAAAAQVQREFKKDVDGCGDISIFGDDDPPPAVFKEACDRAVKDHGKSLFKAFIANAPKMMFIFLPLLALMMLPAYWRPRRLYVEHVVFALHTHAFVFVAITGLVIINTLDDYIPGIGIATGIATALTVLWILFYPYRAMRVFYRQGRLWTLTKFAVLAMLYFVLLLFSMLGNAILSAIQA